MILHLKRIVLASTPAASVVQTLVVRVLLLFLSLGSAVLAARTLGPAGRGEQSAMGLWPYLVSGLATLGVAPSLNYHTSRNRNAEGGLLLAASILAILTGIVAAVAGMLVVPYALVRYSPEVVHAAQALMLFSPVLLLSYVLRANFEARGDFLRSNMSRLWPPLFTLASLFVMWVAGVLTPLNANLALFVPTAIQAVWLAAKLWSRISLSFQTLMSDAKTLLSYGLRSYPTDIMNTLSVQVDQAIVIAFLSPSALGLYTVGLTASRTLNVLQNSVNTVLFPKASGLEFDSALALVGRMTRISNAISAAGVLVFILIIPYLVTFFYGRAFQGAADVTRILSVEAFLAGAASVLAQGFLSTGKPTVVTSLQGAWVATAFVLLTILVPRFGIAGAAYALVAASFARLVETLVCYPLILRRPIPRLIPLAADVDYVASKIRSRS